MSTDYTFKGWQGHGKDAIGNMTYGEFNPRPWNEDLVDIEISHAGICGSDLHTLRSGWGPTDYPCVVGHEIVGKAVRVGNNVQKIKVGDIVGVGAQGQSCLKPDCDACADGDENLCPRGMDTYNSKSPDGHKSYGGYANYHRAHSHFTFKIPDGLPLEMAAPMMCGGVTLFNPLVENGCGPGKKVGIVGLGGLGHFGVLFAKALKADKVVVISRSRTKEGDAKKMGADDFIATAEDKDWATKNAASLDLIVCTVSDHKMPIQEYLGLLRRRGQFIQVGAPEDAIPGFNIFALIGQNAKLGGSAIGSPKRIAEMLQFAAEHKIQAWIEQRPMKDANQATVDLDHGKARYRYCLVN